MKYLFPTISLFGLFLVESDSDSIFFTFLWLWHLNWRKFDCLLFSSWLIVLIANLFDILDLTIFGNDLEVNWNICGRFSIREILKELVSGATVTLGFWQLGDLDLGLTLALVNKFEVMGLLLFSLQLFFQILFILFLFLVFFGHLFLVFLMSVHNFLHGEFGNLMIFSLLLQGLLDLLFFLFLLVQLAHSSILSLLFRLETLLCLNSIFLLLIEDFISFLNHLFFILKLLLNFVFFINFSPSLGLFCLLCFLFSKELFFCNFLFFNLIFQFLLKLISVLFLKFQLVLGLNVELSLIFELFFRKLFSFFACFFMLSSLGLSLDASHLLRVSSGMSSSLQSFLLSCLREG